MGVFGGVKKKGVFGGVMVSKLDYQTIISEFESQWVPVHTALCHL